MQTLLLVGCYLPVSLIPAVIPLHVLVSLKPAFRWISTVPLASSLLLIIFYRPLIGQLSYAIAILPVLISLMSLSGTVIGVRLVGQAIRHRETDIWLVVATIVSAIPFLVIVLLLVLAWVPGLIRFLGG